MVKIQKEILYNITRDPNTSYTISHLAKQIKSSRVSIWKNIKTLVKMNLIIITYIGEGKSKTQIIKPNWENILLERLLLYYTTLDASEKEKWQYQFKDLENKCLYLILFGSMLINEKYALDIDILIISNKKNINKIDKQILELQKTSEKEIHATIMTPNEIKDVIKQKNNPIIDAIQKGIILYGQDIFISLLKEAVS